MIALEIVVGTLTILLFAVAMMGTSVFMEKYGSNVKQALVVIVFAGAIILAAWAVGHEVLGAMAP